MMKAAEDLQGKSNGDSSSLPLFSLRKIEWEKKIPKNKGRSRAIHRIAISSGTVLIGTSSGTLVRWKLNDPKEAEEIELSTKGDDIIDQIFLDPTANHALISCKNGDVYYLHSKTAKLKRLSKFLGSIECAAFDRFAVNETTTKSILVGTSLGCLYEIVLDSSGKEKVFQLIYQLSPPIPINSVYFETFSGNSSSELNERCYALFSTDNPLRLYHLVGSGSSLGQLFQEYSQGAEIPFVELPGDISKASLLCFSKVASAKAETFALLTGAGIYHGSLREIRSG